MKKRDYQLTEKGMYPARHWSTTHLKRLAEIDDQIANDPTLPDFWPTDKPGQITAHQWYLALGHLRDKKPVKQLAEEMGITVTKAHSEMDRVMTELIRSWESRQNPHPDNEIWIIPAQIKVVGPKTKEQALAVAMTWQKLNQVNVLNDGRKVSKQLTISRTVEAEEK